jgi:hypothetical protein
MSLVQMGTLKQELQQNNEQNVKMITENIAKVDDLMGRVALYTDFKDLYRKVVPGLEMV